MLRITHVVNQIRILIEESKKRLDNDYYKYELEKLRIMFETHISNELNRRVVESYRNVLQEELEELFNAIQEMRLDELDSVTRTEVSLPAECLYPFSKLSDAVYGDGYTSLVASDNFKKYIGDIVDLENIESTRELYVVIKAGFYKYYTER